MTMGILLSSRWLLSSASTSALALSRQIQVENDEIGAVSIVIAAFALEKLECVIARIDDKRLPCPVGLAQRFPCEVLVAGIILDEEDFRLC